MVWRRSSRNSGYSEAGRFKDEVALYIELEAVLLDYLADLAIEGSTACMGGVDFCERITLGSHLLSV